MGLLLINFSLQCFHILAWPLLALGYPLYASIQAIEVNSDSSTRKLITYWVCLSFVLLLDHAFYWLPYWPFVKLMIVCCLTIPRFDGSFYIYNRLVRPMLSVNPRADFDRFIKMLEIILKEESPLTVTTIASKETEPHGLQNLISSKGMEEQPKVERKHIIAEEIEVEELSGNDRELGFVLQGGMGSPDFAVSNKRTQNEWTCAVCQVTTTSVVNLISHLQGKQHADALDKMKPKDQMNVFPANSRAETEDLESKAVQTVWTCVLCKVKCPGKAQLISHFLGKKHTKALESLKAKPDAKYYFRPWTCQLCERVVKNRNELILHLQSKRHLAACANPEMEMKRSLHSQDEFPSVSSQNKPKGGSAVEIKDRKWSCATCNVSCTGAGDLNQHLNGNKHLARAIELSGL